MDNKYQDLYIYDWKNHKTTILREIQITQIKIYATYIHIDFINGTHPMSITIAKKG